jgi:hypothetical protein
MRRSASLIAEHRSGEYAPRGKKTNYVHTLLFECPDCNLPVAISHMSSHGSLESVDADTLEIKCHYCGTSEVVAVMAKRHYVDAWPAKADRRRLGHAKSLREICGGLAASEGKLRHLGLPTAPSRSTLAYANEHRPWQLHRTVFEQLLAKCQMLVDRQPETRKKEEVPFQESSAELGCHGDRSLRHHV